MPFIDPSLLKATAAKSTAVHTSVSVHGAGGLNSGHIGGSVHIPAGDHTVINVGAGGSYYHPPGGGFHAAPTNVGIGVTYGFDF